MVFEKSDSSGANTADSRKVSNSLSSRVLRDWLVAGADGEVASRSSWEEVEVEKLSLEGRERESEMEELSSDGEPREELSSVEEKKLLSSSSSSSSSSCESMIVSGMGAAGPEREAGTRSGLWVVEGGGRAVVMVVVVVVDVVDLLLW